ncbi:hypothetical protein GQ44DRAFT_742123 [Phaeosphaeriaceae sp. PMI808]|nr:hypothetical protein GQ44DRAFT_742123 [Phaeosphaeriaceae sp. PMI808]
MGDKDPSPFGYTFSSGYLDSEPPVFDTNQSLLTDIESQSIADFFTNTDPFHLADPHAFAPTADIKDGVDDFSNWANFITPATVHGVSTTIPDQAHLQNTLFNDHAYPQPPLPLDHLGNTHDDLQAASTLFQNSQSSYADNRPLDYNTLPSSSKNANINSAPTVDLTGKPLVLTHNGLIIEQLAALLPNHAEEGTLDAQFAAHWANNSVLQSHSKLQRENLTEEQKRSNHILSEQKRRNLIKRGFDELHDLVPEIRNGGLSKSSVLTEAANFLEKLIEENNNFRRLTGG